MARVITVLEALPAPQPRSVVARCRPPRPPLGINAPARLRRQHYARQPTPSADPETSRVPYEERACMPGSPTTPGRPSTRASALGHVAFHYANTVGTKNHFSIAAQWLACTFPCRRFADILADACARLGAVFRGSISHPLDCSVRFVAVVTFHAATLATRWTLLPPGHRLDRASFAWRTTTYSLPVSRRTCVRTRLPTIIAQFPVSDRRATERMT
jgi:hypothetical protein